MKSFFGRATAFVASKFGYDKLGTAFYRYLCTYICFMIASLLSTSYFNIFLLKIIGTSDALTYYNLLLACLQPFVMLLAVPILRHTSVNFCQRVGLGLHAAAYLWLTVTPAYSELMVYAVSCAFAAGNAFYYTSYTPQLLAYTEDDSRDIAFGSMGLVGTIGSLTIPLLAGFFISAFGDVIGYRVVFAVSAVSLCVGVLLSFRLQPIRAAVSTERGILRKVFGRMMGSRDMRAMLAITLLTAAETSGKALYVSVLVYGLLKTESVIGVVTTVGTVLTLLANVAYGKWVNPRRRGVSMLVGSVLILAATLFLNVWTTAVGYIIYFVIYSFALIFVSTPPVTGYMGVLQNDDFLKDHGAEVHALREFFYAAGRALGLIPALFLTVTIENSAVFLIAIVLMQLLSAVLMMLVERSHRSV